MEKLNLLQEVQLLQDEVKELKAQLINLYNDCLYITQVEDRDKKIELMERFFESVQPLPITYPHQP